MAEKIEKWLTHEFSTGERTGDDYKRFQSQAERELKLMCEDNDLELHTFNRNHYCFSAVLKHKATGVFVYISVSDVRFSHNKWYSRVLYRTMKHDKDWCGGNNMFCMWSEIGAKAAQLAA